VIRTKLIALQSWGADLNLVESFDNDSSKSYSPSTKALI